VPAETTIYEALPERIWGGLNVAHSEKTQAQIERLRAAIGSLNDPQDLAIAEKYIRQLEEEAEKERRNIAGRP
jgi:hypothetical protein